MKGDVLGLETIVSLIAVLAGAVFLFLFISPAAFEQLKENFCLSTGFCGNQVTIYTSVAKQSVDALACAISSTAEGNKLPCVDKFEENQPDGPYVACSTKEQLVCCDTGFLFGGEYWMTRDLCEASKYTEVSGNECGEWFSENRSEAPEFSCVVRNFNLPQTLGEATIPLIGVKFSPEKWIEGYGDPQYLVYYQRFPAEEDTWSFKADWKVYTLIVVTSLPVGRMGKFLGKAWEGLKKASKFFAKESGPVAEQLLLFESKQGGVQLINRIADPRNAINFVKGTIAALKKSKILSKDGIKRVKRFLILAGAAEGAEFLEGEEYATEYAESVLAKFNPEAGKIILKVPFNKPLPFELSKKLDGKPVLIQFRPKVAKREKQLHLASPCKLDVLPVFKEATECPAYLYNIQTGYTECSLTRTEKDPIYPNRISSLNDSDLPLCQGIIDDSKFTENPISNSFIDFFRNLKGANRPTILENYFDGRALKILLLNDIIYQISGQKNFSEDKLIIQTSNENKQLEIETNNTGDLNAETAAQGKIKYKDAEATVYKFCQSWSNEKFGIEKEQKEIDGEISKIDCRFGIKVDKVCSNSTDFVCNGLENINSQKAYLAVYNSEYQSMGDMEGSFNVEIPTIEKEVNVISRAVYYNNLKEDNPIGTRAVFVGDFEYTIGLVDSTYTNTFDRIEFYSAGLYTGVRDPEDSKMFIADADFDGTFESYGTTSGCKSEAVFADLVDAVKSGDTNYCVSEKGLGWGIAENVGYYGGWTLVVVGSAVAIVGTGGLATPIVAGIAAGTAITTGFTAIAASEISELSGGWPDN